MTFHLCLVFALLLLMTEYTTATTERKETILPPPGDLNRDLNAEGTVYNPLSLLGSNAGTLGPLGLLGLNPQAMGHVGVPNPLLSNLFLTSLLSNPLLYGNVHNPQVGQGHNPLLAFLLSQYGRYLPYGLGGYGLYGFSASNNVHNSKSFGNYKYEDRN